MQVHQIEGANGRKLNQITVAVGERYAVLGNWSEASIHLGVAGKPIEIELVRCRNLRGDIVPGHMAQIWVDGKPWSFPVLPGEAGFHTEWQAETRQDRYYLYEHELVDAPASPQGHCSNASD